MNERPDTAPVEGEARSRLSRIQHDLAVELAKTRDLGSGLARCLDAALAAAEVEAGGIYVTEEATGDLVLLVHRGLSAEFVDEVRRVPRDSVRGRIAESRTGAFASLRDSDRTMLAAEAREGLTICGTVTLWDQERVVGSLNVASGGPAELSAAARDALETIAAEATQAIVRLAAEERVREQERNFRAFFETIDDIILVAATDGRVVYANPAAEQKLGYTAEELRRLTVAELHPAGVREEAAAILAAMLHGERDTCPLPLARKDGSPMPAETRVWFGEWSGRRCLFGRSKDLTAEQEAKQRFERLFRHNPLPMALSTLPERRFADVNDAWLAFFGFGRSDVIGRTSDELGISAEPRRHDAAAGELRERGVLRDFEMRVRTPAGELRDGLFSGETVRSQGKEYFLTVMVDLTERRRAEEALRRSEERFRGIFEESVAAIFVFDEAKRFTDANSAGLALLGYTREELLRLSAADVDADPAAVLPAHGQILDGGRVVNYEHSLRRKDGTVVTVLNNSRPLTDGEGRVVGMQSTLIDITARKRLEREREAALTKYRTLFESFPLGITVADRNGRIVETNRVAERLLGVGEEEHVRRRIDGSEWTIVRRDGTPMPAEEFASVRALREGRVVANVPMGIVKSREGTTWLSVTAAPVDLEDCALVVSYGDISAHTRAEDALRESEARFRALIESAPDGVVQLSREGRFLYASPAARRMFGLGDTEWQDVDPREWTHPEDLLRVHGALQGVLDDPAHTPTLQYRFRHADGRWRWIESTFTNLLGAPGIDSLVINFRDIHDRRLAEEALAEEATRRRILVEESRDGIVVLNEDGGVFEANRRFAEMLGYSPEEVRSLRVWDWDRNWEPEQVREAIRALGREGRSFETRHWRKDGSSFDVELSKSAAELGGRKLVFCVCRDISGRKRLESIREVLLSLGGQLNRTTDAPSASRALLGAADRLWAWDAAVVHLLEGDRGRSRRVLCIDTVDGVRREMPTAVMALSPRARRVVEAGAQLTLRTSETEGAGGGLPFGDLERRSWSIMDVPIHRDDQIVGVFSLHNHRKGAYTRDDLVVMQALADFCGGALERIRSEETARETSERLRQTQKLEAIGQLAGGVAHDFNNILAAMMMNLGLLEQEPGLGGEVRKSLRELEEEAQRAAGLTRQLLMFSRRSVLAPTPLDLNEVVDNLLKMLRRLIGEQIALRFDGATSLPLVQADAGMMEQVVMNLVVNARDAMPEGGRLVLATGVVSRTAEEANGHPNARPGRFVCLTVTDTGCGMTPETMGRIFEPFFTTKRQGEGTGLGLATVHGIVAQHQGWVEVESTVGRGAVFRVLLPVLPETRPVARAIDPRLPPKRGRESLLIVEDDAILRQVTEHALRALGYRVKAVANGPEAIQWWATAGTPVDLVLTDMVMPEGMTGLELVERLRESRPGLKAIVTSGYSAEITRPGVLAKAGVAYLPKPYEARSLAEILRAVLDGPAAGGQAKED